MPSTDTALPCATSFSDTQSEPSQPLQWWQSDRTYSPGDEAVVAGVECVVVEGRAFSCFCCPLAMESCPAMACKEKLGSGVWIPVKTYALGLLKGRYEN